MGTDHLILGNSLFEESVIDLGSAKKCCLAKHWVASIYSAINSTRPAIGYICDIVVIDGGVCVCVCVCVNNNIK